MLSEEPDECFNVLISSAGRRVVLLDLFRGALRNLGLAGRVVAADVSALSSAFHAADDRFLVPPCSSPEFIPEMVRLCVEQGIRLVIPTIDAELATYAASRHRFEAVGTTVAVSHPEVVRISADKAVTNGWLVDHGFPTVRQSVPAEVLRHPDDWVFPLLVKPRAGNSSRGVAVVADIEELGVRTRAGEFLVETIAPGIEHTVDLLVDGGGRCVGAVPRRRLEVRAGEVSKGMTVRHEDLEDLGCRVAEALPGAWGVLNMQVMVGPDDEFSIVEINPRFGGGYPLSWRAGADYPRRLVEEVLGRPGVGDVPWVPGMIMLRYDEAVYIMASQAGL